MDFKKLFKAKMPDKNIAPVALDEEDEEILHRRAPNKAMIVTALCALIILVMILSSLPKGDNNGTAANMKVLSGKPEMASISTVITGAGTLAPGDTEAVELPKVIDLVKYYVHNGDKVLQGDVLASVDKVQVAAAIGQLQSVMNTLDKDLNSASGKSESTSIKSGVAGRVKAIFAQPGDDVSEVVYENGCLMLLSLDGMMSVTFPAESEARLGQVVDVTLSDGSTETGRVYSVSDGKITVTITDVGAPYGDKVTVKTEDGKALGSGELTIHSPLQISGYYGTVASVSVKLNQKVGNGTQLITLKDPGHTAEYAALLKRRNELTKQMDMLYAMSDGFIRATTDGIVSEIPEDAEFATAEDLAEVAPLAFTDEFANVKLDYLTTPTAAPKAALLAGSSMGGFTDMLSQLKGFVLSTESGITIIPITALEGITVHEQVTLTTKDQLPTALLSMLPQEIGEMLENLPELSISQDKIYSFGVMQNPLTQGWIIFTATEEGGAGGMGGMDWSGILGSLGGMASFRSYSSASSSNKVYDTYSTETNTIMELVPLEELTITISVDELDILRLKEGMAADITMDAFPGTTFPGTVTRVGAFGVNSGGNAKYAVKVSLHTTEQMLVGMNASLSIVTDTSEAVLTIPAAAIVEENGKTWVYTKYDKGKDVLTGLTEITTGMSDGQLVQILDGLNENSVFYYRYADRLIYSFV